MKQLIVIIGAGPSGSTCAHFLARSGIQVLLADKEEFPRGKPCGDAQLRQCHPLLHEMGLYETVKKQANILQGVAIGAPDGGYQTFYSPSQEIFCTPRRIIDDLLRRSALDAGAEFMGNYRATELLLEAGHVLGVRGTRNGKSLDIHSDLVIVADGAHSRLARQLAPGHGGSGLLFFGARSYYAPVEGMTDVLEFFYPDPMFFPAGYIWIFPLTRERANVGVFISQQALKRSGMSLNALIPWFQENTKIGRARLGKARPTGPLRGSTLPIFEKPRTDHTPGALVLGDAGSLVDPLFGGGFHYAMGSGKIAAEVILEAWDRPETSGIPSRYNQRIETEMAPEFHRSQMIRERLFTNPEDLNTFIHSVSSGADPDLQGKGLNEAIRQYLKRPSAS